MGKRKRADEKPWRLYACLDIETNNGNDGHVSTVVSWQLSWLRDFSTDLRTIGSANVRSMVRTYIIRDHRDAFAALEAFEKFGLSTGFVPIVMVHNLAFEMWALSPWLNARDCQAVCKSTVKPLTITVLDAGGEPSLVFWDTLAFFQKPLGVMGDECGYPKLTGCWDYDRQRDKHTPLSEEEEAYAIEDAMVPWAYMGYWLRLNPEVDESLLASRLLTKTSVVRWKSLERCRGIKGANGKPIDWMWRRNNETQRPQDEDMLMLMHAATRGGFTYCAREHASRVFTADGTHRLLKYDANSMHIFHGCGHMVPVRFERVPPSALMDAFGIVSTYSVAEVLAKYANPFSLAFHGRFRFENLRLKPGSVFERNGVSTLAQSRFKAPSAELDEDNEAGQVFSEGMYSLGYHDECEGGEFAFGKLYSADSCVLILNELSAWEVCQQFEWDSVEAFGDGYATCRMTRPSDKSLYSFNLFYRNKTLFKRIMGRYERSEAVPLDEFPEFVPSYIRDGMHALDYSIMPDVKALYLNIKADLNSLYGIEATNEAKPSISIGREGLYIDGEGGLDELPEHPKAWYQYGMRIVGWSRIHQVIMMMLLPDCSFVCGDTDSHKLWTSLTPDQVANRLEPLHQACTRAMEEVTRRTRGICDWFPMSGLGWYELEGEPRKFCAAWNKAYIELGDRGADITLAGVPCDRVLVTSDGREHRHGYNAAANALMGAGWTFEQVAETFLGYNVRIHNSITGLNVRHLPDWGIIDQDADEPRCIHLAAMHKVIGDTRSEANRIDSEIATRNNPDVNTESILIHWAVDEKLPTVVKL